MLEVSFLSGGAFLVGADPAMALRASLVTRMAICKRVADVDTLPPIATAPLACRASWHPSCSQSHPKASRGPSCAPIQPSTRLCPCIVATDMMAPATFPCEQRTDAADLAVLAETVMPLPNNATVVNRRWRR